MGSKFILSICLFATLCIIDASDFNIGDSIKNDTLPSFENICKRVKNGLFNNGPCESTVTFCQEGQLINLTCPSSLIFNPSSNFCEIPEHFTFSEVQQLFVVEPVTHMNQSQESMNVSDHIQSEMPLFGVNYSQPFVGQIPNYESQDGQQSPSVFLPSVQHYQPFVGQIPNYGSQDQDEQQSPSVFLPSVQHYQPFVGQIPNYELQNGQQSIPSVFLPRVQHYQPFVGQIPNYGSQDQDEQQSPSVFLPNAQHYRPFVAQIPNYERQNGQQSTPSVFLPRIQQYQINDHFLIGSNQPEPKNLYQQPEKLVDDFKPNHQKYEPKVSIFAPLDILASAGHDSFRTDRRHEPMHSIFAPMNSPVEFGHDIFRTRHKRSTNQLNDIDGIEKCRKLFSEQLANRTIANNGTAFTACVRSEIPSRCTQFYLACVNGQQVKRHCPEGLFLNPSTESCKRRAQIAICNGLRRPSKTSQQSQQNSLGSEGKQMKVPQASHRQQQRPTTTSVHRRLPSILPTYAQFYPEKFCTDLPDGFYRHPKNCSRILQCFASKLFEYPPCQHGLAFNQLIGVCDYRSNVPGCFQLYANTSVESHSNVSTSISDGKNVLQSSADESQQNGKDLFKQTNTSLFLSPSLAFSPISSNAATVTECSDGHHHGDHIKHPERCSLFYRCVWGRMVTMSCPRGTAFNPQLSVCDYPSRVPDCEAS